MSSINKIKKIQYHKKSADIINLIEYIVFQNDTKLKKQIVFKFHNNLNQNVYSFQFEVSQYNEENLLIEKSIVEYNKFISNSRNNDFVPESRLNVNYDCARIECHLLMAKFERVIWENGVYSPIPYTIDEFRKASNNTSKPKQNSPVKAKKKEKVLKNDIRVKDVTRVNVPKGHIVYLFLACVILILGMFGGSILFKIQNNEYYDGAFQYSVNEGNNTCIITGYESSVDDVIIPNQLGDKYTVLGIGKKAFKNSNVKRVTIEANELTIDEDAFYGSKNLTEFIPNDEESILKLGQGVFSYCTSLKRIELRNVDNIFSYTFYKCNNLEELIVPDSTLYRECLKGCVNLKNIEYKYTNSITTFKDLFGDSEINVQSVITNNAYIPTDYFGTIPTLTNVLLINPNVNIEFGAFSGINYENYFGNETVEYLNGSVLHDPDNSEFILSDFPDDVIDSIISKIGSSCVKLTIDCPNMEIKRSQMEKFRKLKNLVIKNCKSIEYDALNLSTNISLEANTRILSMIRGNSSVYALVVTEMLDSYNKGCLRGLPNLYRIEMPFVGLSLQDLGLTQYIHDVIFTRCQGYTIPKDFMYHYYNINEISFPEGITSISSNAISSCDSLQKIDFPKSVIKMEKYIIGKECYNLFDVTLPFVGISVDEALSYEELNLSSSATSYLTILGKTSGGEQFSKGLENAIAIDFEDTVTDTKYLLQYCFALQYVKFTNNKSIDNLTKDLLLKIDWLFLDNVGKIKIENGLLKTNCIWMNNIAPFSSFNVFELKNVGTKIYCTGNEKINYDNVQYNYTKTYKDLVKN